MTAPAASSELWRLVSADEGAPTAPDRSSPVASRDVLGARGATLAALERIVAARGCREPTEESRRAARRLLGHLERLRLPARHLWTIVDHGGRVLGGALAMPGPGRTAQVLASRPHGDAEQAAVAKAIDAAVAGLHGEAAVAQALLDDDTGDDADAARHRGAYLAAGFATLATLDYLARPMPRRSEPPSPALPPGAAIAPWRRGDEVLPRVLEASYEGTLDCPGLCGLRRTADILEGHLAGARYEPGLWSILHLRGDAVGALLLSPSHGGEEIDLVYLGLAASARGRGLGRVLLLHGLRQLAGRRERRVVLAVDRANAPAMRLYASAGFVATASRLALIRAM